MTFFLFSNENWKRDYDEVEYLVSGDNSLLYRMAKQRTEEIHARNIRFKIIGEYFTSIAPNARAALRETQELTKDNTGPTLVMAIDYGGQQELLRAASLAAADGSPHRPDWSVESFAKYFYIPEMPPVDLLIRTSGERRVSNYMLWHLAYAELMFLDVLWPDFNASHLEECIGRYRTVNRRFGK